MVVTKKETVLTANAIQYRNLDIMK